jgi:cytochrome oxidase Cu insertion factor (SCO1/SenC/PrrC family)
MRIAPDYGLYYAIQPGAELQPDYPVDHSTATYLVDREGRLVRFYTFGTETDVIADDIQELLG